MGLDMYLMARRENQQSVGVRGACGGLIPMAPKTDKEEIGYWRKAYSLMDEICSILDVNYDDINCKELELNEDVVKNLKSYCEDGIDFCDDEWEKSRLKDGVKYFNEALELIHEENAQIYFMCWY